MSRGQSSILQNLFQLHFAKEYLNSKSNVSEYYYVVKSPTLSLKHKSPIKFQVSISQFKFMADNRPGVDKDLERI